MIIPIGTKSSLALKPMLTIGLIVTNVIIAMITFPLSMGTEKSLFKVRRDRYAEQVKLYISEHGDSDGSYNIYIQRQIDRSIKEIENAEDYFDLEMAIMDAILLSGASFEDLEEFGTELAERTDLDYINAEFDQSESFSEWKRLMAKEEKVIQGNVSFAFGLVPSKMDRVHTFITHIFLHGGIWHLLGNMLFLWVVGCLMEDSWGRIPFLVFYLCGGVFAGLAHCLQDTSSAMPLIGASGAIAAAMGAFTIRHFWTKIKFFYFFIFLFRPLWGTFHLPACVFLPFWFLQQITLKYLSDFMGGSDVAYLAHIAGYIGGLSTALVFKATNFEQQFLAPRVQRKQVEAGVLKDPRFDEACNLIDRKQIDKARQLFTKLVADRPEDLTTIQDIAMIYKENGLTKDYNMLADKILKSALLTSQFEEAASISLEIIAAQEPVPVNPQYMMRTGKWLADNDQHGQAHDIYRWVIKNSFSPQVAAKASLSLARLYMGPMDNPRNAMDILEEASELPLDAEWMERITEMKDSVAKHIPVGSKV
ncbi:MAG: rhomboid family intramembrane serine protease [bacterium]|nr:MAG: rhomboid family intramembrane serine protease [bacterium]